MTRKPCEFALWAALPMAHTTRIEGRLTMILDATRPRRALTRRALLLVLTPGAAALVTLAMLRLDTRAQAAPAPVVVALAPASNAHLPEAPDKMTRYFISPGPPYRLLQQEGKITWTRPHLSHLAKALPPGATLRAESTLKRPKAAPPKAVPRVAQSPHNLTPPAPLPPVAASAAPSPLLSVDDLKVNGASLLAGVTEADKPGGPWWSTDGAVLPTPVYDTSAYRAENHAGADTHNVSFAIRLPASAQDLTVQYDLPRSVRSSSDGFWPTKLQENAQKNEVQLFAKTNGARVLTAAFPPSLKKTSLRVGIASGPWRTVATDTHDTLSEPAGYMSASPQDGRKFIFSPVSVSLSAMGGVMLSVSTDATDDLRLVAVTTQGQTVLPDQIGGNSIGTLNQITAQFSLPLAQIKEIRIETRPFRWLEFKDIALRPVK